MLVWFGCGGNRWPVWVPAVKATVTRDKEEWTAFGHHRCFYRSELVRLRDVCRLGPMRFHATERECNIIPSSPARSLSWTHGSVSNLTQCPTAAPGARVGDAAGSLPRIERRREAKACHHLQDRRERVSGFQGSAFLLGLLHEFSDMFGCDLRRSR